MPAFSHGHGPMEFLAEVEGALASTGSPVPSFTLLEEPRIHGGPIPLGMHVSGAVAAGTLAGRADRSSARGAWNVEGRVAGPHLPAAPALHAHGSTLPADPWSVMTRTTAPFWSVARFLLL